MSSTFDIYDEKGQQSTILVVGLICLDVICYCDDFPIEDSDVRCEALRWELGGNAKNNSQVLQQILTKYAKFASQTRFKCELLAALVDDTNDGFVLPFVRKRLQKLGIFAGNCVLREIQNENQLWPTAVCFVNNQTGSRTIQFYSMEQQNLAELQLNEFVGKVCQRLPTLRWVHFEGRNFFEYRKMIDYLVEQRGCNAYKYQISVEIEKAKPNIEILISSGADFVFISKVFAQSHNCQTMVDAVNFVAEQWAPDSATVICAWAEKGACVRAATCDGGDVAVVPSYPPEKLVDTLGAGDTFIASVIAAICFGKTVKDAVDFGCKIAGRKCGQRGFHDIISDFELAKLI